MASSNTCWGIEIGAGGVRGLKLQADGGSIRVLDFISFDHPKVLSTPELDQDDAMRVALGMLASQYDLSNAQVAISVPGHQSFARFAKLPPVEPKKVPDIVKFEAVQQIPFPLEDVEWDYQTFVSPDSPEVEVGIFAITRQRIMERLTLLQDVGITPDVATLSPIALYNAFAYDLEFTETTLGTILLDIGTMASDLVIAHSGRVWVRTFPIGGHQFTEALAETFKLPYSKAEKLKREAEQSKHARHVFQAMRPVFTDLVQEVQRSIGYYQSLHPNSELKRLIGVGSTFALPGLRKYLKQQLQMDVYKLEQFKRINVDGPRAGEFQTASINLATAYGLALQGLRMATLEANLMPTKLVREAMWRRKTAWFGAAAAVAAAASAALFIRPMMDNAAITAAGTPAQFQQAINDANARKAMAQEKGALAGAGDQLQAEQMIQMLDSKEIFGHIVSDVGAMLAAAERQRGNLRSDAPIYTVNTITTDYRPGKSAAAAAPSPSMGYEREMEDPGFNEFVRPGMPGSPIPGRPAPGSAVASSEPSEVRDKPRIYVEMQLTTIAPDPYKFTTDTIEQWLRENVKRAGLPYEIFLEDEFWSHQRLEASAATPGGRDRTTQRGPRLRGPETEISEFVPMPGAPGGRGPMPIPEQGRGGGGERPYVGGGGTTQGEIDLDRLAPLSPPEETGPAPTATVTVRWYVILEPAAEASEGGES
ncbi:MAG: type IV pilus assembly protein PilM [Phycisphaerales bacterium]|nr:type IV pilus assembly protein PilM [Phycisphaerales bacterium]